MPSPRRVLIIRTSRFVGEAIASVRAKWPDSAIRVVHQADSGPEQELDRAGIAVDNRIAMAPQSRVSVWSLLRSRWGWRALAWRPDAVVIQWWNTRGEGHEQADFAALAMAPRGFYVYLQGGDAAFVPATRRLGRAFAVLLRRLVGVALVGAIAVTSLALWPAAHWRRARERRRMAAVV